MDPNLPHDIDALSLNSHITTPLQEAKLRSESIPYAGTPEETSTVVDECEKPRSASLMGVPGELRNMIWKDLFEGTLGWSDLQVLLTNPQIHQETTDLVWPNTTFNLTSIYNPRAKCVKYRRLCAIKQAALLSDHRKPQVQSVKIPNNPANWPTILRDHVISPTTIVLGTRTTAPCDGFGPGSAEGQPYQDLTLIIRWVFTHADPGRKVKNLVLGPELRMDLSEVRKKIAELIGLARQEAWNRTLKGYKELSVSDSVLADGNGAEYLTVTRQSDSEQMEVKITLGQDVIEMKMPDVNGYENAVAECLAAAALRASAAAGG